VTRAFLRIVARLLIGAVFVAQWAVAAYACPALSSGAMALPAVVEAGEPAQGAVQPGMAMDPAVDCDDDMVGSMDSASPNLCAEHCKQGQQSDQASSLSVPTAILTLRYALRALTETTAVPRVVDIAPTVRVAAFPPHAILHCVFRI
jgi:hypothetical protein